MLFCLNQDLQDVRIGKITGQKASIRHSTFYILNFTLISPFLYP
jgi:hypothetical protein